MALELLCRQVTMPSSRDSQHSRITALEACHEVRSLATNAAAVALSSEQLHRAIELLEQGRGILFGQLIRYQTAAKGLQAANPRLTAEFTTLNVCLENSVKQNDLSGMHINQGTSGGVIGRNQQLTQQWSDVVSYIRVLAGFASFLKPTPFDSLRHTADEGPVIIVNISETRSDAIILRNRTDPNIVKLPEIMPLESARYPCAQRHSGIQTQGSAISEWMKSSAFYGSFLLSLWWRDSKH